MGNPFPRGVQGPRSPTEEFSPWGSDRITGGHDESIELRFVPPEEIEEKSQSHGLASEEADGDGASWYTNYVLAGPLRSLMCNCNRAGLNFTETERQKVHEANVAKNVGEYRCDVCGQKVERRDRETPMEPPSREGSTIPGSII